MTRIHTAKKLFTHMSEILIKLLHKTISVNEDVCILIMITQKSEIYLLLMYVCNNISAECIKTSVKIIQIITNHSNDTPWELIAQISQA